MSERAADQPAPDASSAPSTTKTHHHKLPIFDLPYLSTSLSVLSRTLLANPWVACLPTQHMRVGGGRIVVQPACRSTGSILRQDGIRRRRQQRQQQQHQHEAAEARVYKVPEWLHEMQAAPRKGKYRNLS